MGKLTKAQQVLLDQLKAGYRILDDVHALHLKDADGKHVGTVQGKTFAALYGGYLTIQKEGRKRYYVYDPSKDTVLGIDTQPAMDKDAQIAALRSLMDAFVNFEFDYDNRTHMMIQIQDWQRAAAQALDSKPTS